MAAVALSEKILSAKTIICDIEGTTTSISFVKDTLFPYALKYVEEFLKNNWNEDSTKTVVTALREQAEEDKKSNIEGVVTISAGDSEDIIPEIVKNVEWQMSLDRKTGSLKTLQGLIWAKGYKDGTIKGHVYDDVQKAFEQWTESGRKIYIYSSGSVDAQKLLFEHSEQGNLLKYLTGHYDTKIGAKQEKESYDSILKNIDAVGEEVLFLTDVFAEAKAANEAGLSVVLLERPGNSELSEEERNQFSVITTFSDLTFENLKDENGAVINGKRKIEETTDVTEEDKAQEPPTKVVKVEEIKKTESTDDTEMVEEEPSATKTKTDETNQSSTKEPEDKMEVDGTDAAPVSEDKKNIDKIENDEKSAQQSITEKVAAGENKDDEKTVQKDGNEKESSDDKEENSKVENVPENRDEKKDSPKNNDVEVAAGEKDTVEQKEENKESHDTEQIKNDKDGENKTDETEMVDSAESKQDSKSDDVQTNSSAILESKASKKENQNEEATTNAESNIKKTDVEVSEGVETKSNIPADEVGTEVKEDTQNGQETKESVDATEKETPNDEVTSTENGKEDGTAKSLNGEEAETKAPTNVNGATTDENVTTNGGSSVGDEEKNGDSDKENDTSLTNCDTDETVAEKSNGNTAETTNADEVTSTEIKTKKIIEVAPTPAVTPSPTIEADA